MKIRKCHFGFETRNRNFKHRYLTFLGVTQLSEGELSHKSYGDLKPAIYYSTKVKTGMKCSCINQSFTPQTLLSSQHFHLLKGALWILGYNTSEMMTFGRTKPQGDRMTLYHMHSFPQILCTVRYKGQLDLNSSLKICLESTNVSLTSFY